MATLGTFTNGDVLSAADLNAIGTWTAYTPTVTQGATTFTLSVNESRYTEINDVVIVSVRVTLSGTGVAGNFLLFTLPVTPKADLLRLGNGFLYDSSVPYLYVTQISYEPGAGRAGSLSEGSNGNYWGLDPNLAAASSDQIAATLVYEKA